MVDETRCPWCGAALLAAGDACRRCLLALGLETAGPSGDSGPASPPTGESLPGTPDRVGPFRIRDVLGERETGATYLCEEDDPAGRRVTLRVVERTADARSVLARFEAERDLLARIHHPGVVTRVDAGESEDGRLWFATEWVPGVPITEYCDRERLPVRQRLALLVEACEAIENAHTRGLLHLHLEPSKLLVAKDGERPCLRVLGFGETRSLDQRPTGQLLYSRRGLMDGTLGLLSPEQLDPAGPAPDARTDVYALGALLYELLVGVAPFEARRFLRAGWAETTRIIGQETPEPPSRRATRFLGTGYSDAAAQRRTEPRRLVRELRGDLDWITLKALEKEPTRRYASAGGLGHDLQRLLDGEPVAPGLWSAARRLLRTLRQ